LKEKQIKSDFFNPILHIQEKKHEREQNQLKNSEKTTIFFKNK